MKPILAALLCASALGAAAPVMAQNYPPPREMGPPPPSAPYAQPGRDLLGQIDGLDRRIHDGIRDRRIDGGEADRALRELANLRDDQSRMRGPDGRLTDIDRGRLQDRIDWLSQTVGYMESYPGRPPEGPPPPAPMGPPPPRPFGPPPPPPPGPMAFSIEQREAWMQDRINQARDSHSLTRSEVYRAQRGLNDIRTAQAHLLRQDHGVLRDVDRRYLEQRLDHLRDTIRWFHDTNTVAPWARPF